MTDKKYVEIDTSKIKKIDGKLYVPSSEKEEVIKQDEMIPLFFARICKQKIHHDSPVIGACEYGETYPSIDGPFSTESEAKKVIKKRKEETDHISYEFSSQIISRCYLADKVPQSFDTVMSSYSTISVREDSSGLLVINGEYLSRWSRYKEWKEAFEKISEYHRKIKEKVKEQGITQKTDENYLLAKVKNTLIEIIYQEYHWPERELVVHTFSQNDTAVRELILQAYHELGNIYFWPSWKETKYLVASPAPEPVGSYNSIDDFIKAHDFL